RQKLLFDYFSSIIILFGFPFIFIFQKRPLKFFSNLYFILIRKKTWVGYSQTDDLPVILPPIIFIESENSEAQSFMQFDYAKNYHWRKDFRILWSNIFHH
ncbi:MAG: hypothetical protein RJA52_42, partial [Bacteroidota bacterium]